ncbi:hypothetical protein [Sphingobacterium gobiense]|uniref:hypothetical protein n=1 Tax=Sphingobacterium gobiense TaxID=1382456 RepID=UPI0015E41226|nr:hypothetical protein [Sphingobacterium gobiense]
MRNVFLRIAIFVLVMMSLPLEGNDFMSFITELLTTGVLEWFKTLFNKRSTYYF